MAKMDKIQNIVPKVLLETADKYVQAQKEACQRKNERFKRRVTMGVRNYFRDFFMVLIIIGLVIAGIIFLRKNTDGE